MPGERDAMKHDTPTTPLAGLAENAGAFGHAPASGDETDGRKRRRIRNREAVVDALLDLYHEGNLRPSSDEIAERAGLSPRSLFRYFDDVDDLASAAVARQQTRALPFLDIAAGPEDERTVRVKALVDQRFRLFDELGQAAKVTRLRAPFQPVLAGLLAQNRAFFREQVRQLFAAELDELQPARARSITAALDILASFECYDLLLNDQEFSPTQAKSAMAGSLGAVLASAVARNGSGPD